jgi:hypothetical protein
VALFTPAGANYIAVVDIQAAAAWYIGKLGLRKVEVEMDDERGTWLHKRRVCLLPGPVGLSSGEPTSNAELLESAQGRRILDRAIS